jgi:outer membrane protein OmpA-like peptidoglycan-associated protein
MKKNVVGIGMLTLGLCAALMGCQTTNGIPRENSIMTEQAGLSPRGDNLHATIDFALFVGRVGALHGWKVQMVAEGGPQKEWSGNAENLPTSLTWDGRRNDGSFAPEGVYTATLSVDYGKSGGEPARSHSFILDISPPTGSVSFSPSTFVVDSTGAVEPTMISVEGSSVVAGMDSWSLDIFDSEGRAFRSFDGEWSAAGVMWDGKSTTSEWVAADMSYTAQATLRDEFGNYSRVYSTISVGGLPEVARPEPAPGTLTISPATGGFSPTGTHILDTMKLALAYGPHASVSAWRVEILDSDSVVRKSFQGNGSNPAMAVSWDGRNDAGSLAQEGKYTARLSVDYGTAFSPGVATSVPFVLDLTPPTGWITLSEPLFSPMESTPNITIGIEASSSVARIDSWRMEIYDPENHLFRTFVGTWRQSRSAVWDGKGFNGDLVRSVEEYPVVVKVRDEFGNVGELKSIVPVDILVESTPTGFRIVSSRIFFKPYTADFQDVRPELAAQNKKRLDALAEKLKKFPDYRIRLVGHAVMVYWDDAVRGAKEQRDVLLPLSRARAEAVKNALVARGLARSMFTTEGVGAADQLVPDSDRANRWQNRRVAFYIQK